MLTAFTRRLVSQTANFRCTLFPGDGIGPEITDSVVKVFDAAHVPINWDSFILRNQNAEKEADLLYLDGMESARANKVALKGPLTTEIGKGHRSINVLIRQKLDLYANVRPSMSIPGIFERYTGVDLVTIRENTEGEYSGKEHEVVPGVIENLKIISARACTRVCNYAFKYAKTYGRKKVTAFHKASVMKLGDGLFLRMCREAAEKYPEIAYEEKNVDTCCGLLAVNPGRFDVMVMPNLYGDIVSDLCAGLIGGLGLTASGNIGEDIALFEAVHGSAPDIAGKNKANPTALLLSGVMVRSI
jgi:isocitrate dehydrogenase (NAD+)